MGLATKDKEQPLIMEVDDNTKGDEKLKDMDDEERVKSIEVEEKIKNVEKTSTNMADLTISEEEPVVQKKVKASQNRSKLIQEDINIVSEGNKVSTENMKYIN